nr:uncharacterized protein LOC107442567 [Parasteatoda tepidariorum]
MTLERNTILKCKISGEVCCFFMGAFGFFFTMWKQNTNAAVAFLILEIVCAVSLRLNANYYRIQKEISFKVLQFIKIAAFILFISLMILGITDIVLGIRNKQGFQIGNDGYYFASIPGFLGSFWSFVLFWDCKLFQFGTALGGMDRNQII